MHSLDWEDLRLVLVLARAETTSEAAELMGVNQSTVSRRLATLREQSGRDWFVKKGRKLVPTPAGQEVVEAAERMERESLRVQRKLTGANAKLEGLIRVSGHQAILTHLAAKSLTSFTRLHPKIQLRIDDDHSLAELERKQVDVILRIADEPPPALVGRRYGRFTYGLYQLRDATGEPPLLGYPPPRGDLACRKWVGDLFPDRQIQCRIEDDYVQYQLTRAGMGIAQLPCFLADPDPLLSRVDGAPLEQGSELWVLTHAELRDAAPVAALMKHLHQHLSECRDLIEGSTPNLSKRVIPGDGPSR